MWEFYLAGCEANFRFGGIAVFQIQLSKRLASVPLTPRLHRQMGAGPSGQEIRGRLSRGSTSAGQCPGRCLGLARDDGQERAGRAGGDTPPLLPILDGSNVEPVGLGAELRSPGCPLFTGCG